MGSYGALPRQSAGLPIFPTSVTWRSGPAGAVGPSLGPDHDQIKDRVLDVIVGFGIIGEAGGEVVFDGGIGGSGPYSSSYSQVGITVAAVNDAPVLADTVLSMPAVVQGATAPVNGTAVGALVSSLVGGITDVDAGAVKGIAITGVNTGGTLYYSLDGGTTWTAFTDFTSNRALGILSDSDNRVYFVPASADVGTIASAFTFRAWDQSGGAAEGAVTVFGTGTSASYSAATDTVSQYVVKPVTINAVSTDNVVGASESLVVSGTAENNATVALSVKGQTVNVVADVSGNWLPLLADVPVSLAVEAKRVHHERGKANRSHFVNPGSVCA